MGNSQFGCGDELITANEHNDAERAHADHMAAYTERVCPNGHRYRKSSACPTCPACEAERKPEGGLLAELSAPARRALERQSMPTAKDLANFTTREILALHGVGPSTIPTLERALAAAGLSCKK